MSCDYCKNKSNNKPLVESEEKDEIVFACVQKRDDGAYLRVDGWYNGWYGGGGCIEHELARINYCPMCGERLVGAGR